MNRENIILRIRNLLELSKSSNINESQNAILKAQELLIKHNLSMREVKDCSDKSIIIRDTETNERFRSKSWKVNLANEIAENFKCYTYLTLYDRNINSICFYGKYEDVIICEIMFKYALKYINLEGNKLVREMKKDRRRKNFSNIKKEYALGFVKGLEYKFRDQITSNKEWGLVIQKDKDLVDRFNEFSKYFERANKHEILKSNTESIYFYKGIKDGNNFSIENRLENDKVEKLKQLS